MWTGRVKYENDRLEDKKPTFYESWNSSEINIISCYRLSSYQGQVQQTLAEYGENIWLSENYFSKEQSFNRYLESSKKK